MFKGIRPLAWLGFIRTCWRMLWHPDTPRVAKLALVLAGFYLVWPLDLIADVALVFGLVDDLAIVTSLILLAMKLTPEPVLRVCRGQSPREPLQQAP